MKQLFACSIKGQRVFVTPSGNQVAGIAVDTLALRVAPMFLLFGIVSPGLAALELSKVGGTSLDCTQPMRKLQGGCAQSQY